MFALILDVGTCRAIDVLAVDVEICRVIDVDGGNRFIDRELPLNLFIPIGCGLLLVDGLIVVDGANLCVLVGAIDIATLCNRFVGVIVTSFVGRLGEI